METQEDSNITKRMNVDLFERVTYSSLKPREINKEAISVKGDRRK